MRKQIAVKLARTQKQKTTRNEGRVKKTCPSCKRHFTPNHMPDSYIGDNCFECSFWLKKVELPQEDKSRQVIFSGQHYMIGVEDSGPIKGFGGSKFIIFFYDGRKVETSNLWSQGEIPERFRKMLLDNAHLFPV